MRARESFRIGGFNYVNCYACARPRATESNGAAFRTADSLCCRRFCRTSMSANKIHRYVLSVLSRSVCRHQGAMPIDSNATSSEAQSADYDGDCSASRSRSNDLLALSRLSAKPTATSLADGFSTTTEPADSINDFQETVMCETLFGELRPPHYLDSGIHVAACENDSGLVGDEYESEATQSIRTVVRQTRAQGSQSVACQTSVGVVVWSSPWFCKRNTFSRCQKDYLLTALSLIR